MGNQPFFFIQISDVQFGMLGVNGEVFQETQLWEKMAAHVNRLRPVFVVNTGDLLNEPGDEKQLSESRRVTGMLDGNISIYTIPGNHDVGDAPTEETLGWYRREIGDDWYSFDYGRWHFIGLNSCIIADGQHVPQEAERQWEWLNHDLEAASPGEYSGIIVFMHHPLFLKDRDEGDDYFTIAREKRQLYLDLFGKYGVKAVFAGHLHQNNLAADSDLEIVTTNAVGMPLGEDPSGFRIVKVCGDHIEHRYFGLDDVISNKCAMFP